MATFSPSSNDIRLILCVQGYYLEHQFILRELGYWYKGNCGSLPFNCKINLNKLDCTNQNLIVKYEELHGMKLKKNFENGLTISELKPVIKSLYHIAGLDNEIAKYICVVRNEYITSHLYNAGMGLYVTFLDQFHENINYITEEDYQNFVKENKTCNLHENVNDKFPLCAAVKAKYIAQKILNIN